MRKDRSLFHGPHIVNRYSQDEKDRSSRTYSLYMENFLEVDKGLKNRFIRLVDEIMQRGSEIVFSCPPFIPPSAISGREPQGAAH